MGRVGWGKVGGSDPALQEEKDHSLEEAFGKKPKWPESDRVTEDRFLLYEKHKV